MYVPFGHFCPDGDENGLIVAHWDGCCAHRTALPCVVHVHAPHDEGCFVRKVP